MAGTISNDDKRNLVERGENSDEDLIQFSHSEPNTKNDKHVLGKQNVNPPNQSTVINRTDFVQQQSVENAAARPKTHNYQVSYPPAMAMPCPRTDDRAQSSGNNAGHRRLVTQSFAGYNRSALLNPSPHLREKQRMYSGPAGICHTSPNSRSTKGSDVQTRRHHESASKNDSGSKSNLPKCPKYEAFDARVSSFDLWPPQIKQSKEQMAEAGLYYTGSDDLVRCFQCGGNLRGWKANDEVWIEHAQLFPLCPYVRAKKGKEFIESKQETINERDDLYGIGISMKHFNDMGFSKCDIIIVCRHLENTGNSSPSEEDIVNALLQWNN